MPACLKRSLRVMQRQQAGSCEASGVDFGRRAQQCQLRVRIDAKHAHEHIRIQGAHTRSAAAQSRVAKHAHTHTHTHARKRAKRCDASGERVSVPCVWASLGLFPPRPRATEQSAGHLLPATAALTDASSLKKATAASRTLSGRLCRQCFVNALTIAFTSGCSRRYRSSAAASSTCGRPRANLGMPATGSDCEVGRRMHRQLRRRLC